MSLRLFNKLVRPLHNAVCLHRCKTLTPCFRFYSERAFDRKIIKEEYVQKYLESLSKKLESSDEHFTNDIPNSDLIDIFKNRQEIIENIQSLRDLEKDDSENKEWKESLEEEKKQFEEQLDTIDVEIINALAPKLPNSNAIEFEITAGVGGQEAMLFAKELYEMYQCYFNYKSWSSYVADIGSSDIGGLRHACFMVEGFDVLKFLQHESGVHRVQRVPATEKYGRVHTSTVTVSVCPHLPEVEVNIAPKDLIIETKRSSGAGGQHVNTTDSCVRILHVPTGIAVESQTERSQIKNKEIALRRLQSKIYKKQSEEQDTMIRTSKKSQVGTSARSDKVRTYNYIQDRITDHRLHQSWHGLPQFFKGGPMLDDVMEKLVEYHYQENLTNFLTTLKTKVKKS